MAKIALGNGKWFSTEKAEAFEEGRDWDGRNHISRATGSQWEHQRLYHTASGRWVLNHWSQYQGHPETYEIIDDEQAITWLVRNEHDFPEDREI